MSNESKSRTALVRFALGLVSLTLALTAAATAESPLVGAKNARLAEKPTGEKMIPPPKLATEREQIEKCLVEIYVAQTSYFAENNRYAGNRRVLGLFDEGYCKTLKLNFKEVKPETYVVTAESKQERWMINEAKEIFQLK